jgi:hypothetical protein
MSTPAAPAPLSDFVAELFEKAAPRRSLRHLAWGIALLVHASVVAVAVRESRAAPLLPRPLEVELAPPAPPPNPVPAPKLEERAAERTLARPAAAAPPEPARAAALLTAKEDPPAAANAAEPVDFTNDPNALGFGSGVVAVGGKAQVGLKHAQPSLAPSAPSSAGRPGSIGEALTPASDLSRKPSLGESDPCRGYFPSAASDDVASAAVMVTIGKSGAVSAVQLLSESPPKQGFGGAARACMTGKRFSPGLDRDGRPTATAIRVNVRFTR